MVKRVVGTALVLAFCLANASCRSEYAHGVLVARFSDRSPIFRAKIALPSSGESYQLVYELRQGPLSCSLTAALLDNELPVLGDCAGRSGSGKISCSDGREFPLSWSLASCRGGFGRSQNPGRPVFLFGFGLDPDQALDQLDEAENAG